MDSPAPGDAVWCYPMPVDGILDGRSPPRPPPEMRGSAHPSAASPRPSTSPIPSARYTSPRTPSYGATAWVYKRREQLIQEKMEANLEREKTVARAPVFSPTRRPIKSDERTPSFGATAWLEKRRQAAVEPPPEHTPPQKKTGRSSSRTRSYGTTAWLKKRLAQKGEREGAAAPKVEGKKKYLERQTSFGNTAWVENQRRCKEEEQRARGVHSVEPRQPEGTLLPRTHWQDHLREDDPKHAWQSSTSPPRPIAVAAPAFGPPPAVPARKVKVERKHDVSARREVDERRLQEAVRKREMVTEGRDLGHGFCPYVKGGIPALEDPPSPRHIATAEDHHVDDLRPLDEFRREIVQREKEERTQQSLSPTRLREREWIPPSPVRDPTFPEAPPLDRSRTPSPRQGTPAQPGNPPDRPSYEMIALRDEVNRLRKENAMLIQAMHMNAGGHHKPQPARKKPPKEKERPNPPPTPPSDHVVLSSAHSKSSRSSSSSSSSSSKKSGKEKHTADEAPVANDEATEDNLRSLSGTSPSSSAKDVPVTAHEMALPTPQEKPLLPQRLESNMSSSTVSDKQSDKEGDEDEDKALLKTPEDPPDALRSSSSSSSEMAILEEHGKGDEESQERADRRSGSSSTTASQDHHESSSSHPFPEKTSTTQEIPQPGADVASFSDTAKSSSSAKTVKPADNNLGTSMQLTPPVAPKEEPTAPPPVPTPTHGKDKKGRKKQRRDSTATSSSTSSSSSSSSSTSSSSSSDYNSTVQHRR